jgi:chemotaxis protein MotB
MTKKRLDLSNVQKNYLMPYIGVMTIVCIFFVYQYGQYSKEIEKRNAEKNRNLARIVAEDLKTLENVKIQTVDSGIKVTLPSSIMFDLSLAKIKKSVVPVLEELSNRIKSLNNEYLVIVEGHTDNAPVFYGGDFSSNWELSLYRSISVIDFLIQEGNPPELFTAAGYGEFRPIYPNDTPEHQALNRRVEITIRKKNIVSAPLKNLVIEEKQSMLTMNQNT